MALTIELADLPVAWRCKCGHLSFRHHEHCDRCGEKQPAPPRTEPSDKPRIETV